MASHSNGLELAKPGEAKLVVRVCGRSVVFQQNVSSLAEILGVLRNELGMHDQVFEVYDSVGQKLIIDADMVQAMSDGKVPFTATLSDASIHYIENRREELAQMQWKLIRDQQTQLNAKLNAICRQVSSLETGMEADRSKQETAIDLLHGEVLATMENVRESVRIDLRQLDERVAGVGHLVSAERNMREASIQKLISDLQAIRDAFDTERHGSQQRIGQLQHHVEDLRKLVERERAARENLDDKFRVDTETTRERMDEMTTGLQDVMNDYGKVFEKASADVKDNVANHWRVAAKERSEMNLAQQEAASRICMLEDRHASLENRQVEANQRQSDIIERLNQRSEKATSAVEMLRLDCGKRDTSMNVFETKVQEFDQAVNAAQAEVREIISQERRRREEDYRGLRDAIMTETGTLLSSLEGKVTRRLERESAAREGQVADMICNVKDTLLKDTEAVQPMSARPVNSGEFPTSTTPSSRPTSVPRSRPMMHEPGSVNATLTMAAARVAGMQRSHSPVHTHGQLLHQQGQLPVRPMTGWFLERPMARTMSASQLTMGHQLSARR